MIMGHVSDTAFLPKQKTHITWSCGDTAFLPGQKPISPHSEHLEILQIGRLVRKKNV